LDQAMMRNVVAGGPGLVAMGSDLREPAQEITQNFGVDCAAIARFNERDPCVARASVARPEVTRRTHLVRPPTF